MTCPKKEKPSIALFPERVVCLPQWRSSCTASTPKAMRASVLAVFASLVASYTPTSSSTPLVATELNASSVGAMDDDDDGTSSACEKKKGGGVRPTPLTDAQP